MDTRQLAAIRERRLNFNAGGTCPRCPQDKLRLRVQTGWLRCLGDHAYAFARLLATNTHPLLDVNILDAVVPQATVFTGPDLPTPDQWPIWTDYAVDARNSFNSCTAEPNRYDRFVAAAIVGRVVGNAVRGRLRNRRLGRSPRRCDKAVSSSAQNPPARDR